MTIPPTNTRLTTGDSAAPSTPLNSTNASLTNRASPRFAQANSAGASGRLRLDQRTSGSASADTRELGDVSVVDLTPVGASTPLSQSSGPRTLTAGGILQRTRSMFNLSDSPLGTAVLATAAIGAGILVDQYVPGVSDLVRNLATSVFYNAPLSATPLTPAELLRVTSTSRNTFNLTRVVSAAVVGAGITARFFSSRKREADGDNEDDVSGSQKGKRARGGAEGNNGSEIDVSHIQNRGKNKAKNSPSSNDSGMQDTDGNNANDSHNSSKIGRSTNHRRNLASRIEEAANPNGAGSAGVHPASTNTDNESERQLRAPLARGASLAQKLEAAGSQSGDSDARSIETRNTALANDKSNKGKSKATNSQENDTREAELNSDNPNFSLPTSEPRFPRRITSRQQGLYEAAKTDFLTSGGEYLARVTYGNEILPQREQLIHGTPLRVMTQQNHHFIKTAEGTSFQAAHEFLLIHKHKDAPVVEWKELQNYKSGTTFSIPQKATKAIPEEQITILTHYDIYLKAAKKLQGMVPSHELKDKAKPTPK